MKNVHFILQGKGGVGKSVIASFLAQYFVEQNKQIMCIDTDPVNQTFAGYEALLVKAINILDGDEINTRNFDVLVQNILDNNCEHVIIDNGASSFVPLSNYIVSNDIAGYLDEENCQMIIHVVITGGQAMFDTLSGFNSLVNQFPAKNIKFVVWLNPFWGLIEAEGKNFLNMRIFQLNQNRILSVVELPRLKEETFGRDLSDLLQSKKTFNQGIADISLQKMTRRRLQMIKEKIFTLLAQIDFMPKQNLENLASFQA